MTGRNAAPELIDLAHTVTEMKKIKHVYDQGVKAIKGIEF
jgi:cob(I)alamin adenosyltransferase